MEEELYDEFGNYIGPEINDSEEENETVGRFRYRNGFIMQQEEEEENWNMEENIPGRKWKRVYSYVQKLKKKLKIQMFEHMKMQ